MKLFIRKQIRKLSAGILIVSMLVMNGCGREHVPSNNIQGIDNESVPMGRYVEKNLDFPGNKEGFFIGLCQTEQGLEVYMYDETIKLYKLANDEWVEQEVLWQENYKQLEEGWLQSKIYKKGEETYFAYCMASDSKTQIYKINKNNVLENLNINWEYERDYVTPENIVILPDGDIIVSDIYMGVHRYNTKDGTFVRSYGERSPSITVIEDKIYEIAVKESSIKSYDLETSKLVETIPCEGIDDSARLIQGKEGGLYLVNNQGINHLVEGGSIWERIIDADRYSFNMPALECIDILEDKEVFFALFVNKNGSYQLKKYVYSIDTPSKPQTEVFVYMLENNATLKQAITQYQLEHPEVQVSFQIGLEEGSTLTKSDAIRALHTELLAGKGPDLLVLDDLPIETYMEKGMLEDMSIWAKPYIEQDIWLPNVATVYEREEKLYALATRFTFPTIWGDDEVIKSSKNLYEFANWCQLNPDKKLFPAYSVEQFLSYFYLTTANAWKDERGYIKEEELIKFLEAIKVIQQQSLIKEKDENTDKRNEQLDHLLDVAYGESAIHIMIPESNIDLSIAAEANRKRGKSDFARLGEYEGIFIPKGIVGINVNSDKKEIVKGIIEAALSESVQGVNLSDGFAVNQKALLPSTQYNQSGNSSFMMVDDKGRELITEGNYTEVEEKFFKLCKEVKKPVIKDEALIELMRKETMDYFKGEMTAKEAAQAISRRVQAYLVE